MLDDRSFAISQWRDVVGQVEFEPAGRRFVVEKFLIAHPRDAGAYLSVGWPAGQDEDYRFPPEHDCRGVHVQSVGPHWIFHVDRVHPECSLWEHLRRDVPVGGQIAGAGALGAMVGAALGRTAASTVAGTLLGLALGALLAGRDPAPAGDL